MPVPRKICWKSSWLSTTISQRTCGRSWSFSVPCDANAVALLCQRASFPWDILGLSVPLGPGVGGIWGGPWIPQKCWGEAHWPPFCDATGPHCQSHDSSVISIYCNIWLNHNKISIIVYKYVSVSQAKTTHFKGLWLSSFLHFAEAKDQYLQTWSRLPHRSLDRVLKNPSLQGRLKIKYDIS